MENIVDENPEIWKPVRSYERHYIVSNKGNVKSLTKTVNGHNGSKTKKGRLLKKGKQPNGYLIVGLSKNGKSTTKTIHRLVATAFLTNVNKLPEVNHNNGIKTDNRVENLEWCSRSQNIIHAIKTGLFSPSFKKCIYTPELREKRAKARIGKKLTEEVRLKIANKLSRKIICITDNIVFDSMKECAAYYGVSKTTFHRFFHRDGIILGKKFKWYNQQGGN